MTSENNNNADLLSTISEELRANNELDQELVEILTTHLLKVTVSTEELDVAKKAIEELAAKRGVETNDAHTDNN